MLFLHETHHVVGKREDEIEYALITADIGPRTTSEILEGIRQRIDRRLVADDGDWFGNHR